MRAMEPDYSVLSLGAMLDALPIVAFLARPDGSISYVSRGWREFLGHDPADVLGDGYVALVHPDQRVRVGAVWQAAQIARSAYRDEMLLRVGDGSYRWVVRQAQPMHDPATEAIVGWFGTLTDIDEQKRAAEHLRAQVEFNDRLIASSDDCIKILDLDARLVSMSANGQILLAIKDPAAIIGAAWPEFWAGADRVAADAAIAVARAGGTGKFVGYFPVEDKPRWFDVVVTAILDAAGQPEKLLVVSRDITSQRLTTAALEESEQRYRAFGEALPGVAWTASPAGELDFVSDRWSAARGRDRKNALGDKWLAVVHPHDRNATAARWRESVTTGKPYDAQFRVVMADGSYRWQLVRALPMRDATGTITRWVGVNIDIDEQRRADEARDLFVALAENSGDFIAITDRDHNVVYVNEAGRRLLEIDSLDSAKATPLIAYFRSDDRDYARTEILAALEREGRRVGDFAFRNFRTGAAVPVAYNFFNIVDRDGKVSAIATVSRDRSRQRQIESGVRLLARIGAAALDSLDSMATLHNIARAFVPDFASYCLFDFITPERRWQRTVVHEDAAKEAIFTSLSTPTGRHPIALALEHGTSSLVVGVAEVLDTLREHTDRLAAVDALRLQSFIAVPVTMPNGEIVGGMTCARDSSYGAGDYVADDLAFVEEAGRRAGAAIANVRLYERERRIAVELQAASLPATLPSTPQLRITADYRPGSDEATIGGDWYDALMLADGRVVLTVGDVLGHGLHAAVTMTKLRQAMQAAAMVDPDPNVMLAVADKTLRLLDADGYATAVAAIYDGENGQLTFASAGHPGPIVRSPAGTVVSYTSPGLLLGLRTGKETDVTVIPTPPQSTIVFFTDGLVEATRDLDAGSARLQAAIERDEVIFDPQPAHAIVEYVLGSQRASDDVAVLVAQTGPSRTKAPKSSIWF